MPAKSPTQILREQMSRIRESRGISQQELADRLAELGVDSLNTRDKIVKIERLKETGGEKPRRVTLDEALAIAAALSVPPSQLFLGLGVEERVALTPKMAIHPDLAARFLEGDGPPATSRQFAYRLREWHANAAPVRIYRALHQAQENLAEASEGVRAAEYANDDKHIVTARAREAKCLRELADVLQVMHRDKVEGAPKLHDNTIEKMQQLGIELPGPRRGKD